MDLICPVCVTSVVQVSYEPCVLQVTTECLQQQRYFGILLFVLHVLTTCSVIMLSLNEDANNSGKTEYRTALVNRGGHGLVD